MNKKYFFAAVIFLSVLAVGLHIAFADVQPSGTTLIQIDIKPGSYPNTFNLGSNGVIPVAILSYDDPGTEGIDFDATDESLVVRENIYLEGLTVALRGNDVPMSQERDVNGDGLVDLVVQIEVENPEPYKFQDGQASLWIQSGAGYWGVDEITLVP